MKNIIMTLVLTLSSLLSSEIQTIPEDKVIKDYQSIYTLVNRYKNEIKTIEKTGVCDINNNIPTTYKYFSNIFNRNIDSLLQNALQTATSSNSSLNSHSIFFGGYLKIQNDIVCMIIQGMIFASALDESADSIFTKFELVQS